MSVMNRVGGFAATHIRFGVIALAVLLAMVTYLDRACMGTCAPAKIGSGAKAEAAGVAFAVARDMGGGGAGGVKAGDGPGVGAEPAREEGVEGRPRGVAALAAVDAEALDEAANTVNTRSPSRLPSRLLSRVPSRFPSRFPGRFPRDWRHLASGSRRRRALRRSRCPAIRRPSRAGPYPSLNQGDGFCVWRGPAQRETRRLRPTPRLAPPPPPPPSPPAHDFTKNQAHESGCLVSWARICV